MSVVWGADGSVLLSGFDDRDGRMTELVATAARIAAEGGAAVDTAFEYVALDRAVPQFHIGHLVDLVVVGTRGQATIGEMTLSSPSERSIRNRPIPLAVVPTPTDGGVHDGSARPGSHPRRTDGPLVSRDLPSRRSVPGCDPSSVGVTRTKRNPTTSVVWRMSNSVSATAPVPGHFHVRTGTTTVGLFDRFTQWEWANCGKKYRNEPTRCSNCGHTVYTRL